MAFGSGWQGILHFEGTLPGTLWGETTDCPVYGYAHVYEDAPIIISYFVKSIDKADENRDYLTDIIDRMVKTVRTEP